ncbi:hypothetical protein KSP40_PGU022253 [Platanthera guangdongensis]|uniref:Pectin acetylesterase n=1 Tax=Platanthera guangdongensis TaxID=2320717 RepID=A0ABR2MNH2_9ASPA
MLAALTSFERSTAEGMFINSCFAHCQSELQDAWFAENSPRIHNKSIAEAVGDWYFGRKITKEVGCPYPCDHTCEIPFKSSGMVRGSQLLSRCFFSSFVALVFIIIFYNVNFG